MCVARPEIVVKCLINSYRQEENKNYKKLTLTLSLERIGPEFFEIGQVR